MIRPNPVDRRCAWVVRILCGVVLACAPAGAQEPEPPVTAITLEGLARVNETFARGIVGLSVGEPAEPEKLEAAVTRLLETGRFLSARYETAPHEGGVRVVFRLVEQPQVTAVRFEGNEAISDDRLRSAVLVRPGGMVDLFAVRQGRDAILSLYEREGFADVVVSFDEDRLRETGELVYRIQEGARVRIRRIVFEGNTAFSDKHLRRQIETKTAWWFIRSGAFDEERVESDVARLQTYYRDEGLLDARVTYRTEISDDEMTLIFMIEEGARYVIEAIRIRGNTVFSTDELRAMMASKEGAIIKRRQLDGDVQRIRDRYGELGYIYARVRAVRLFSDQPGLVRIIIEIEEGEQFRVGRVIVRGNTRTKDKVVRRELNLYPPDDLWDVTAAREAERRLLETRIFDSARIYPVGDAPDVRNVMVDVTEAEKAGDFLFGFGVTSNSGLVGNVVLDLQNFDITDWPRSWSEFVKFRSFFGGGQRFRLEVQPGTDLSRFRVDFTEPYFRDRPVRFDLSGYLFERGRDGYTEGRAGASVAFGRRFQRGFWRGWSAEVALSIEDVEIDDLDLFTSRKIRDDEGSNFLTSLKGTLVRDRTDSRFVPTRGDRLRISYEQFVGEHNFGKVVTGYTWYRTLREDLMGRKHVLRLNAEGGAILGDAPVFERFFAGGTGSIRGFEFRGVGERHGIDDNNIGGDFLVLVGAEYSYPLFGENVRGMIFLDTGTAGSGTYRAALGTGVRLTLNLFGPVPLEFGVAVPVSRDSDDEEQVFHFLIGNLF